MLERYWCPGIGTLVPYTRSVKKTKNRHPEIREINATTETRVATGVGRIRVLTDYTITPRPV